MESDERPGIPSTNRNSENCDERPGIPSTNSNSEKCDERLGIPSTNRNSENATNVLEYRRRTGTVKSLKVRARLKSNTEYYRSEQELRSVRAMLL